MLREDYTNDDCVIAVSKSEHMIIHNQDREYSSGDNHWVRRFKQEGKSIPMHSDESMIKRKLSLPRGSDHHVHDSVKNGTHPFVDIEKIEAILTYVRGGNTVFNKQIANQLGYSNLNNLKRAVKTWWKYYPELNGDFIKKKHGVWILQTCFGE